MRQAERNRKFLWALPVISAIVIAVWQWGTVTANYGGNWTALFCTGALQPHPPLVAWEHVYLFANSTGYDGQFYHYAAHDPLLRSGLKAYVDDPRLRYRRILVPLLAYGIAGGRSNWIDPAYEFVFLMSIGLGVYWSCKFAQQVGLPIAWGLVFLLMPAVLIATDRLVVDAALAALTAGFLCYSGSPSRKLFLVLACAALTRETGLFLIAAYCACLLVRREFRRASVFLLSALPALAWYTYVQSRTIGKPYSMSLIPLSAILQALTRPWIYPAGTPFVGVVHLADYLALIGVLLGFGLTLYWFVRKPSDPLRIAAVLFAVAGVIFQRADQWQNAYDFGRVYTPLLLCLSAVGAKHRKPWLLVPAGMILPRIAIQMTPQALGVLRWMA